MKKIIFLFLLLSFYLYSASLPQGLIKETGNGITRITTTNPNFKMVMEIADRNIELKWESKIINGKGLYYRGEYISGGKTLYSFGETIEAYKNGNNTVQIFTMPISDRANGYKALQLRYLIEELDVKEVNKLSMSTIFTGYQLEPYYLSEKDTEEARKLIRYFGAVCDENGIAFTNPYFNKIETYSDIKKEFSEIKQVQDNFDKRFTIENGYYIYRGDKIEIKANINDYKQFIKETQNIVARENRYYNKTDFRIELTFKELKEIKNIKIESSDMMSFDRYTYTIKSNEKNNTIKLIFLPLIDFEINNIPVSVLNPDIDQSKNYNTNTDIFITYKDDKALTIFTENLKKL